jgi:cytochrome b
MKSSAMVKITIVFSVLLIVQGLIFWGMTGFEMGRFTAAIPSFFGVLMLLCALVAGALPKARMHVMHLAVLVALLGAIGGGVMGGRGLGKDPVELTKIVDQGLLALLCIVYLVFAVRSFIAARAARAE